MLHIPKQSLFAIISTTDSMPVSSEIPKLQQTGHSEQNRNPLESLPLFPAFRRSKAGRDVMGFPTLSDLQGMRRLWIGSRS
jgi:hypothetical protein